MEPHLGFRIQVFLLNIYPLLDILQKLFIWIDHILISTIDQTLVQCKIIMNDFVYFGIYGEKMPFLRWHSPLLHNSFLKHFKWIKGIWWTSHYVPFQALEKLPHIGNSRLQLILVRLIIIKAVRSKIKRTTVIMIRVKVPCRQIKN